MLIRYLNYFKHKVRESRADLLVLAFFVIISGLYWWPIPIYFRTHQIEWPPIDPLFNQWILAWDAHAIFHYPWRFFEANMFYPFPHTLAWGDHLFSLAILATPLIPLVGIVGAYNVILLASTALSGFFVYLLAMHLFKNRPAAVLGGVMWSLAHYRYIESGHIQILNTQWIPLVFLFAEKIRTEYKKSHLFWFIFVTFLMLATNFYLALFTILSFIVYILMLLLVRLLSAPALLRLLIGWLVAGLLALPLYAYSIILQLQGGIDRGTNQASLNLHGLLPTPWPGRIIRKLFELAGHPVIDSTWHTLGLLTYPILLVTVIMLVFQWKKWRQNWLIVVFFVIAIGAILAAAGPKMNWIAKTVVFHNWFFEVPYHIIPGYKAMRAIMRWFLIATMFYGLISAWVYSQMFQKIKPVLQWSLVLFITMWIFIEQAPAPLRTFQTYQIADYPVYQWLTEQPGEFAILELPIFPGTSNRGNDIIEGRRMYFSTWHWKKRVGGAITPYIPDEYVRNAEVLNAIGDNPRAIEMLIDWRVKYIIFEPDDFAELGWNLDLRDSVKMRLDNMSELKIVQNFSNASVYYIKGQ